MYQFTLVNLHLTFDCYLMLLGTASVFIHFIFYYLKIKAQIWKGVEVWVLVQQTIAMSKKPEQTEG